MRPVRLISLMSQPAQNAFSPAPVSTIARTPESAASSCQIAPSRSFAGTSSALSACGRSSVTVATPSGRLRNSTDMLAPAARAMPPTRSLFHGEADLAHDAAELVALARQERAHVLGVARLDALSGQGGV